MGDAYLEGLRETRVPGHEISKKLGRIEDYWIYASDLPESGDFNMLPVVKFKNTDALAPTKARYDAFMKAYAHEGLHQGALGRGDDQGPEGLPGDARADRQPSAAPDQAQVRPLFGALIAAMGRSGARSRGRIVIGRDTHPIGRSAIGKRLFNLAPYASVWIDWPSSIRLRMLPHEIFASRQ